MAPNPMKACGYGYQSQSKDFIAQNTPTRWQVFGTEAAYGESLLKVLAVNDLLSLNRARLDEIVDIFQRGVESRLGHRLVFLGAKTGGNRIGAEGPAGELGHGHDSESSHSGLERPLSEGQVVCPEQNAQGAQVCAQRAKRILPL